MSIKLFFNKHLFKSPSSDKALVFKDDNHNITKRKSVPPLLNSSHDEVIKEESNFNDLEIDNSSKINENNIRIVNNNQNDINKSIESSSKIIDEVANENDAVEEQQLNYKKKSYN